MRTLLLDEMISAMQTDDASYDGRFFVCVKTTRIYCLPSCTAKDPLMKNVIFLATKEEAVAAGFRGCRRCRSEDFPHRTPSWLVETIAYMKHRVGTKIHERDLVVRSGVDISTIRRYFKSRMNTTPLAYHRKLRLERARTMLESGSDYLTVAYACGFESASGFRDAFVRQFGVTPGRTNAR